MSEDNIEPTADDSMSVPEVIPKTITSGRVQQVGGTISSQNEIDKSFAQLINLNEGHIFHEPTCLLCSNPHREEIEDKYLETKSIKDVKGFIQTKTGLNIAISVVENHMFYHLTTGAKEEQKLEYANVIKRLTSCNLSTLDTINIGKAACQERLMGINSITPGGDVKISEIEKIKTQETARIMASLNQLLKLQASILGEMRASGDMLSIPRESFIHLFNDAILNANSDIERKIINDLLTKIGNLSKIAQ
ncbi:hypothetical protein D4R86_00800 [bacterium]|nr:MAG: hypothetical protein D4R86_00800 [bacterium]